MARSPSEALPERFAKQHETRPRVLVADNNNAAFTWVLRGRIAAEQPPQGCRVTSSPFRVGRGSDCDLRIADPTVSQNHAEFCFDGDWLKLTDLGSTNGTFVDGVRVSGSQEVIEGDLVQFAGFMFQVDKEQNDRSGPAYTVHATQQSDLALAVVQFGRLMDRAAVAPHFQPIVAIADCSVIAQEVLARSRMFGLTTAESMFNAAAVLQMEAQLSRLLRDAGVREGERLPEAQRLFVNTHPSELEDVDTLVESLQELRGRAAQRPLVLEIHEAAVADHVTMQTLKAALQELRIELAFDDFGAGQARLLEIAEVQPGYVKSDMKLVHGVARSRERQMMLRRLVEMAGDLGTLPLAEGVENDEDHRACLDLGFTHAQGYYYGRPLPLDSAQSELKR